ncbi:CCR3 [Symbiodinium sp. CCMP2456]|nr:CCR3 [Symbiodinium sp. CCMP2456]
MQDIQSYLIVFGKEVANIFRWSPWASKEVLFMSVSGGLDWGYASDIFIELESYYAAAGYLFFIALVALAVLNVVTAVFVEYAMKMAADDRDLVIQDTLAKRNKYMQDAMLVFKEADADGSGSITYKAEQYACVTEVERPTDSESITQNIKPFLKELPKVVQELDGSI